MKASQKTEIKKQKGTPASNTAGIGKPLSRVVWFLMLLVFSALFFQPGNTYAGQATLSWSAPTTNASGAPLTDLAGYTLYYGTASGNYTQNVGVGSTTSYTVSSLAAGTYYFAAKAYDTSGNQSAYSNEVSKTVVSQSTLTVSDSGTGSGTVTSSPSGISCGTTCSGTYNSGTIITLTATAAGNSTFAGWSGGGCGGTGTCSFTVNANTTVSASFTANTATYSITASAGTGGSIAPSGSTTVNSGSSQAYTITPSSGYSIASVLADGASVGAVSSYTFSNVTANHTISATFTAKSVTYTITATAGTGGSSTPAGSTTVKSGGSQAYTITPSSGYSIAGVLADGASVGAVSSYTFSNVTANHTISATFTATSTTATTAVFAVNAGGPQYTSKSGVVYKADTDYSSGWTSSNSTAVSGTNDPTLYKTNRLGNFSYNIPLANGTYNVTLMFCENFYNVTGGRVFNVSMQSTQVISNLDIYAKVGEFAAYNVTIPVSVTNGKLNIQFTQGTADYPLVNAILVTNQ